MPPACSVCAHPEVVQIDTDIDAGTAYVVIAERFAVRAQTVGRHARLHRGKSSVTGAGRGSRSCSLCASPEAISLLLAGALQAEVAELVGISREMVGICARQHWGLRRTRATCDVCSHPDIDAINDRLRSRPKGAGWWRGHVTMPQIAQDLGVSVSVVRHHVSRHLDNPEYEALMAGVAVSRLNAVRRYVDETR